LRLREGGGRSFVFQYKIGGRHRRLNLGAVSAIDISKARETAKDLYAKVRLGQDPAGERAESRIRTSETFGATMERFLAHQRARLRPRSYRDVEHHVLAHSKALHGLQLAKIERRDVATVLASIADGAGMTTANRVRATLSTLFGWAMMQGLTESNPVIGTQRNKERTRSRVLSPVELRLVWNCLDDDKDHYSAIVRLLALTGQRASELADMRRSELRDGALVLPSERTKNARAHIVPLSAPARAIIEAQPRRIGADGQPRDLIFGTGQGGFSGWSVSKKRLDARIAEAGGGPIDHWRVHDLRRTVATGMADLGVQPHIIEAALNHASGHRAGVAGIYNRATYEREKAAALALWAEHLMAIVEGRKAALVPLHRQA
jgi:integrase